ncbi:DNA-binding transcriptional regulator, LysR family [Dyella jiangningensis]|uniref:LysR family transcriptional regulator n=1 Tax=Dyella sp. AtDHG13 TaxID=1938897 RepID=UPI000882635B|nr:LysR family transcriptional regulator [Dyella sp. AtDHG13]PXV59194.1 DNA-binding transcriptional LysR family regulator [Dyella sp. AtDHG13]SDK25489.1 DNA-binding transcriptional regulator, LysR family [Dyella jiangningensis]
MNISLRQLRAFLAVARQQHFRRAAESLHLSQPAVSRYIADLEAELGIRLFDRTTREVVPTDAGRYLESAIGRVLDELEGVLSHVHSESERKRGKVHVASVPTLSAGLMPQCIADCAARYPELTIQLHDQAQTMVLDSVRGGEVDFGVAIDPPLTGEFDIQRLLRDPFVLVCRPDHPLAKLDRVPWRKLQGQPLILLDYSSGSRRLIDHALASRGIAANVVQQTGHTLTTFRMVEAGLGISVSPALAPPPATLVTRPLTPQESREVVLIKRRQRSLSPLATLVWERLRALTGSAPAP